VDEGSAHHINMHGRTEYTKGRAYTYASGGTRLVCTSLFVSLLCDRVSTYEAIKSNDVLQDADYYGGRGCSEALSLHLLLRNERKCEKPQDS
jgi:hypothetical protein